MLSPPEQHHRQPESRASTLLQEEQLSDDMPVVHRHLEKRYEPPPSQLPKKERRNFKDFVRDLRRRFLHFFGIRKESPQPKRRTAVYHTAYGSSLPSLPLVLGSQKPPWSDLQIPQEGMTARDPHGMKVASTQRALPALTITPRNGKATVNRSQQLHIPNRPSLQLPDQIPNNLGDKQSRGCGSSPQDEGTVQCAEKLDKVRLPIVFPTFTPPITSPRFYY